MIKGQIAYKCETLLRTADTSASTLFVFHVEKEKILLTPAKKITPQTIRLFTTTAWEINNGLTALSWEKLITTIAVALEVINS